MVNIVIGTLDSYQITNFYLLSSEILDQISSSNISQAFTRALTLLWPENIKYDSVLLLITSSSRHMTEAANALKVFFPSLIHLTCLSQALNNIAEAIREEYKDIDVLIMNGRNVFIEEPSRISLLKEEVTGPALPPDISIDKCGTWVEAAIYYSNNFNSFKQIIEQLDDSLPSSSLHFVKEALNKNAVEAELSEIAIHFADLPNAIHILEQHNQPLSKSLEVFDNIFEAVYNMTTSKGQKIKDKCLNILSSNVDLIKLTKIVQILNNNIIDSSTNLNPALFSCFKYCPVSCVKIEKLFPEFKTMFFNEESFVNFEDLKKLFVIKSFENSDKRKVTYENEIYIKAERY